MDAELEEIEGEIEVGPLGAKRGLTFALMAPEILFSGTVERNRPGRNIPTKKLVRVRGDFSAERAATHDNTVADTTADSSSLDIFD